MGALLSCFGMGELGTGRPATVSRELPLPVAEAPISAPTTLPLDDPAPWENVAWLNSAVETMWPFLNAAISEVTIQSLDAVLEQYRPTVLKKIYVDKMDLGAIPPKITDVRVRKDAGPDEVVLDVKLDWIEGEPNFFLGIEPVMFPTLKVKLMDLDVNAWARLAFKPLTNALPPFGALLVSLQDKPFLKFKFQVLGGVNQIIPGLQSILERTITTAMTDQLLWPNRLVVPIVPGDYGHLMFLPTGKLTVTLIEAEKLYNPDSFSAPDPEVFMFVRQKKDRIVKSTHKANTYTPKWNETFEIPVEDPSAQSLSLKVMDYEVLKAAQHIGLAVVPLKGIQDGEEWDRWLDLKRQDHFLPPNQQKEGHDEPRGRLHVKVRWHKYTALEGPSRELTVSARLDKYIYCKKCLLVETVCCREAARQRGEAPAGEDQASEVPVGKAAETAAPTEAPSGEAPGAGTVGTKLDEKPGGSTAGGAPPVEAK